MSYPHPFLAREARPFVGLVLLAALVSTGLWGLGWASAFCWSALALILLYLRDAPRVVPADPGAILSPADGRIMRIERVRDPYANRDALLISVFMSIFSGHANRSSVDGVVKHVQYFPSLATNVKRNKSAIRKERNAVVIESNGQIVTLVQVAGLLARRILCTIKPGHTLTRGQRYGLLRFGSRVDVYLPAHAEPQVAPGQKVSATTTILATLSKA
ncbi:MAG: phosphatidylserine decarboxylase family protein [Burkholderiales bacterium]|nr:phosphatidylserine decarboxylase family protein [Burkholderiales bacterium]